MSVDSIQGVVHHGQKPNTTSTTTTTATRRSPVDERRMEGKITPPPQPASSSCFPSGKMCGIPKKNNSKKTRMPPSYKPHENTVICGRGKSCLRNPGNVLLRKFINENLQAYSDAGDDKTAKTRIVTRIMKQIRDACPPEHPTFVKKEGGGSSGSAASDDSSTGNEAAAADSGTWWEVDDAFAREKIGSVFRDALFARYRSSTKSKLARKKKRASSSSRPTSTAFAAEAAARGVAAASASAPSSTMWSAAAAAAAATATATASPATSGGSSRISHTRSTNGPPMVVSFPLPLSSPQGSIYGGSGMFGYGSKHLSMNHEQHQHHHHHQHDEYGSHFPYHTTTTSYSNEELLHHHHHHCVSSSSNVMEVSRSSSLPIPAVEEPFQLRGAPTAGSGQRRNSDPSPTMKTTMDDDDSVVSLPDYIDSIFD
eukprot:CAMPEP_0113469572 /NCGR_PEP_ID=MMETSP0014_2-20120614/15970_1 /TAXON_ID=2857 /ORGANISM="Nitzschia sp." /LENGTH=425 /DNA_ID=CAMNT_0000362057 /DNA_START=181 /DNA_END=1458 /DNA_ORIENTATION=- /assembly_acc=CAM_ASM_000159